jgi:ribonuclease Z
VLSSLHIFLAYVYVNCCTGFYIPELGIMLDAGPSIRKIPSHIFVTHSHVDHCAGLPFTFFNVTSDPAFRFEVHAPAEAEDNIKRYVAAIYEMNDLLPPGAYDPTMSKYLFRGHSTAGPSSFRLTLHKQLYEVDVVVCHHLVPTVGYCFSEIRQHLKSEYLDTDGETVRQLKLQGVEITEEYKEHLFAYICDTTTAVLELNPNILKYPVIFIECTFLYPDEVEQAKACKHVHWNDLMPFVQAHPDSLFVLFHFSLRQTESEIINFFEDVWRDTGIRNIKIWVGDTRVDLPNGTGLTTTTAAATNATNIACVGTADDDAITAGLCARASTLG